MAFQPRSRRPFEIASLIAICMLIVWPFLRDPANMLYIRYFDAETFFDPLDKLVRTFRPWDLSQHLGYNSARAMMYFSLQSLVYAVFSFLGPNALVRATGVVSIAATFAAAFVYLRTIEPVLPWGARVVGALFFASNPYVVGLVHDGYFPLLTQYMLLPVALAIAEWGRRLERFDVFVGILLLFVATSLYNIPLVAIDICAVITVYWRFFLAALAKRHIWLGMACVLATQSFWIVPVLIGVAFPNVAFQDTETTHDIAVTGQYGSLTNVLLLRSNPEFWTSAYLAARECGGCAFYETPIFLLAMTALAIVSIIALYRRKKWILLTVLAAALVLTTGTHYADEILGTPYAILVGLPLVRSIFRGAVKFSSVAALLYAVGIAYAVAQCATSRYRNAYTIALACGTLVVGWPLVSGMVIERGTLETDASVVSKYLGAPWPYPRPRAVVAFPNFPVRVPDAYLRLPKHNAKIPADQPILIMPNQPFAAYAWGAYGNDLVSTTAHHATLQTSYTGEPNPFVGPILSDLGDPNIDSDSAAGYLRALRIGSVVFRKDALFANAAPLQRYGAVRWSDGDLVGLEPRAQPNPHLQRAPKVVQIGGNTESLNRFSLYTGTIVRTLDKKACPIGDPIGYAMPVQTEDVNISLSTDCNVPVRLEIAMNGPNLFAALTPVHAGSCTAKRSARAIPLQVRNGIAYGHLEGQVYAGGTCLTMIFRHGTFKFATIVVKGDGALADSAARQELGLQIWPGIQRIDERGMDSIVSLNESNDPTYVGFIFNGARFERFARKFVPYGFANGFYVPSKSTLYIVQILELGFQFGAVVSLLALTLLARWYLYSRRTWSIKGETSS